MVSIIGRRVSWLQTDKTAKYDEFKGPADFFDYNYPTNYYWFKSIAPFFKYVVQHAFWNMKVEGKENVPNDTNIILMPNHVSHIDSFFAVANLWPRKAFNAIADEKLFRDKYFRQFAKMFNAFPVRKGSKNLNIVKYAINRVNNGDNLLWYPEGARQKSPSDNKCYPGKLGSGMLAHAVNVPVIPCFIYGPEFVMPVGGSIRVGEPRSINILIRYGKPVPLSDLRSNPSDVDTSQKTVNRIMKHIEALRPQGPYIDQNQKFKGNLFPKVINSQ